MHITRGRFTFPGVRTLAEQALAEWSVEAAPSLTVAGPRRIHTGLPCYAPARGTQNGVNYRTSAAISSHQPPSSSEICR
jgi:hypothetical protein